jgi:hypothetical protein
VVFAFVIYLCVGINFSGTNLFLVDLFSTKDTLILLRCVLFGVLDDEQRLETR